MPDRTEGIVPYRIEAIRDEGYILVVHHGELTVDELEDARQKVLELGVEQRLSRVLVDVRGVINTLSISDHFFVTEGHAKLGSHRPRAALIARPDQRDDMRFIETVAVNRGMPLKAFSTKEDALEWLLE
jgi:hypothetical protein